MALPTSQRPAAQASKGLIPAEWPAQAADLVVDNIGKVRDKTTRPALVASRALVYGLLAAVVGTIALILLLVGVVRAYDNWAPGNVWPLYAALAVIFTVAGLVCLKRANRPAPGHS